MHIEDITVTPATEFHCAGSELGSGTRKAEIVTMTATIRWMPSVLPANRETLHGARCAGHGHMLLALGLAVVSAAASATPARCQEPQLVLAPASVERQVNQYTFFWQFGPSVAHLADGSYGIYWEGPQRGSIPIRSRGIHQRQFSSNDQPKQSEESLVDTRDEYANVAPSAARATATRTAVTWAESNDSDRPQETLFLRLIDSDGLPITDDVQFANGAGASDFHQDVASVNPEGFVVSWTRSVASEVTEEASVILAKRFDGNGEAITGEIAVTNAPDRAPISSQIAGLPGGSWVVVWNELFVDTLDSDGVLMRRFASDGTALGDAVVVNTLTEGSQRHAAVDSYEDGRFVVVWEGKSVDRSGWDIFGQKYDAAGTKVGSEFAVNTYGDGDQIWSRVVCHGTDRFTVFWVSDGQDGDGYGLYAQHFDWEAGPVGAEFRVNSYTKGDQADLGHSASSDSDGTLVVAWSGDGDQDGDGYGIFARRYCLADPSNDRCGLTSDAASNDPPSSPTTADAVVALRAAVGLRDCQVCQCDSDGSGEITVADALRILRLAVGLPGDLMCPPCCAARS